MNDRRHLAALIVTGPKDGELIEHWSNILEIPILPAPPIERYCRNNALPPVEIETLTFKRFTIAALSFGYLDCFVPVEWTNDGRMFTERMVLSHLLVKAFKGA